MACESTTPLSRFDESSTLTASFVAASTAMKLRKKKTPGKKIMFAMTPTHCKFVEVKGDFVRLCKTWGKRNKCVNLSDICWRKLAASSETITDVLLLEQRNYFKHKLDDNNFLVVENSLITIYHYCNVNAQLHSTFTLRKNEWMNLCKLFVKMEERL